MRSMTTNRGIRSAATQVAVLAAAALALTACSSSGTSGSSAAASSPSGAASSASGAGGTGASSATNASATSSGSTGAAGSGATAIQGRSASGVAGCSSSQLKVAQENPSVGAGQYYSTLVFTNVSGTTCTLTGYPGVSYVATGGVQSGNAAVRAGGSVATVTLRPGGTASATLHDSNGISGYSPQQCDLSPAQGLRIYPPNQKAALFLPWKTQHCAGLSIHPLTIGPVQKS
ncbi:DUF4232 domain-containing protein [Streptomyces sp. RB6PN25]|uniref:DUF4232 domain-containing protein n=1 Tax=Streptomyces humicola TaxID=2953240 RepID=A0ABT1PUB0_9ACTN|nr:DUF4232 domain-containing protein [Streptomyces humicola]MCQ4081261.1 DUF4232 domain-containing protein [Streptomyces humicola]